MATGAVQFACRGHECRRSNDGIRGAGPNGRTPGMPGFVQPVSRARGTKQPAIAANGWHYPSLTGQLRQHAIHGECHCKIARQVPKLETVAVLRPRQTTTVVPTCPAAERQLPEAADFNPWKKRRPKTSPSRSDARARGCHCWLVQQCPMLWHGLPTVPSCRPQVSSSRCHQARRVTVGRP